MNLYEVKGTVTALGQNIFDNNVHVYAYVEVTDVEGRRTMIEKVAVANDVGAALGVGVSGRFYVDRLSRLGPTLRSQLWGVKTDRVFVFDRIDMRRQAAWALLIKGLLFLPVFGLGLILLPSGLNLLALSIIHGRRAFFYGADPEARASLLANQVARI
jgi:hypothetical protein